MEPVRENYVWEEHLKILTPAEIGIPGLMLFGHSNSSRALYPLSAHTHGPYMELLYLLKGTQTFYVDGKDYPMNGSELFIAFPEEIHGSGDSPMNGTEYYWFQIDCRKGRPLLGLTMPEADSLRANLLAIRRRPICFPPSWDRLLRHSFRLISAGDGLDRSCGRSLLLTLLYMTLRQENDAGTGLSMEIDKACAYVRRHTDESIRLEDLADIAGLSLSRFKVRFKAEAGMTPREYVNQIKVAEGKRLLREGMDVTSVAYHLGFSSSSYFAVTFKRLTTTSPSEYRMLHTK